MKVDTGTQIYDVIELSLQKLKTLPLEPYRKRQAVKVFMRFIPEKIQDPKELAGFLVYLDESHPDRLGGAIAEAINKTLGPIHVEARNNKHIPTLYPEILRTINKLEELQKVLLRHRMISPLYNGPNHNIRV